MKTYDVRVFAVPCDPKGRPVGQAKGQGTVRVHASDADEAKRLIQQKLSQGRGRLIGLSFKTKRSLIAYVEES